MWMRQAERMLLALLSDISCVVETHYHIGKVVLFWILYWEFAVLFVGCLGFVNYLISDECLSYTMSLSDDLPVDKYSFCIHFCLWCWQEIFQKDVLGPWCSKGLKISCSPCAVQWIKLQQEFLTSGVMRDIVWRIVCKIKLFITCGS